MKNRTDKLRRIWAIDTGRTLLYNIILCRARPEIFNGDKNATADIFIKYFLEDTYTTKEQFVRWFPELVYEKGGNKNGW